MRKRVLASARTNNILTLIGLICVILCISFLFLSACAHQTETPNYQPQLNISACWTDPGKTTIKIICEYLWTEAPDARYQDPYSVSWNYEEFRSIPGSIYRKDYYGNGKLFYEDYVVAGASNGKYENYAVLPPVELCKEGPIYGEMSFLVEPINSYDTVLSLMAVYEHVTSNNERITTTVQEKISLQEIQIISSN